MPANEAEVLDPPVAASEGDQVETAVASEPTKPETDKEEESARGLRRKVDKLTREKYAVLDRVERLEKMLETKTADEQKKSDASDPKPARDTFQGTEDEFTEALSRWVARQEHKQLSERDQKDAEKAELESQEREVVQKFRERTDEFVEEHDDYNEVVGTIKIEAKVGSAVQLAIMEDENGPALAYYLGQHPEVCQQMSDMSPARAVAKLGRIAERLFPEVSADDDDTQEDVADAEEETENLSPKPKPVAPQPIKPIKKSSPTAIGGLHDGLTPAEWEKRFAKKMGWS